jgi:transposase
LPLALTVGWRLSLEIKSCRYLALPPYSPELNPVERVWHYLRSHWLANAVFPSLADIMDACETGWNRFAADHALIRSLCAVGWAPASPAP